MTEEAEEDRLPKAEVVFKRTRHVPGESEAWRGIIEADAARMRERLAAQRADRLAPVRRSRMSNEGF
jgi:hypothetical protein